MAATVRHRFSGVFVLDEGQLRRINDIIVRRLPEGADGAYEIRVSRADSFAFVTKSIDEVCKEENGPSIEVEGIRFTVKTEPFELLLEISRKEGVILSIEGQDRDAVFLVHSELKSYIDQGVMSRKWIGSNPYQLKLFGILLMMIISFIALIVIMTWTKDGGPAQSILESKDVLLKLNYLIDRGQSSVESARWGFAAFVAMMAASMLDLHGRSYSFFFPANIFLLGRMVRWYEARIKLRSQIFWSVIVAFIIGAGISAYFAR